MSNEPGVIIGLQTGAAYVEADCTEDMTTEEVVNACFRISLQDNVRWMIGAHDECFPIGIGLAKKAIDDREDEKEIERFQGSLDALNALSAMVSGVRTDLSALDESLEPLPLVSMWKDAVKEREEKWEKLIKGASKVE